jgi:hypothetical protein
MGMSDIVWQNPNTGAVQFWMMSKGGIASTRKPGGLDHNYRAAGIGDFNNDGTDDIFWLEHP